MRPITTTAYSWKRLTITIAIYRKWHAIATTTNTATATNYVNAIATTAKTTTTAPTTMPPRATPTTAMPSLSTNAAANEGPTPYKRVPSRRVWL